MEKEWIPVIATLSGVLVTGLIAIGLKVTDYIYQSRREDRKQLLLKFEALYQDIYELPTLLTNYGMSITDFEAFKSESGAEKFVEITRFTNTSVLNSITKIGSLIKLYAPEFMDDHAKILQAIMNVNAKSSDYIRNPNLQAFLEVQRHAQQACSDLQNKMEEKIKKEFIVFKR